MYDAFSQISDNVSESMTYSEMLEAVSKDYLNRLFTESSKEEIEACAYVLSSYIQCDMDDKNVSHVIRWAKEKSDKEFAVLMKHVMKASSNIIDEIEKIA